MKKYYHATAYNRLGSILDKGIQPGCDGIVYLAETPQDALKFVCLRYFGEDILVIEVEVDETKITETFDHSYTFFRCRAFGYPETIVDEQMTDFLKYERKQGGGQDGKQDGK